MEKLILSAANEIERLRAALKPFADVVTDLPDYYRDEHRYGAAINGVSLRDFDNAFAALTGDACEK